MLYVNLHDKKKTLCFVDLVTFLVSLICYLLEIDAWEVEIIPFAIDFSVKSSLCVNTEKEIKV